MEVCVDNIESAINAAKGGAARIELCSSLSEGGLTPSLGIFKTIKKLIRIKIFVMLRPRGGMDFVYSENEIESMKCDAESFKNAGADGFVFGVLTVNGDVDSKACAEILEILHPLPATFHRAFDCVSHPLESLKTIADLGFTRILTSGQKKRAIDGHELLRKLIEKARRKIIIVPGSGVDENNARDLLHKTGASELHGSLRTPVKRSFNVNLEMFAESVDVNYQILVTDTDKVRKIVSILRETSPTLTPDDRLTD